MAEAEPRPGTDDEGGLIMAEQPGSTGGRTAGDTWIPDVDVPEADRREQELDLVTPDGAEDPEAAVGAREEIPPAALPLDAANESDAFEQAWEVPVDEEDEQRG